ncbi:MAG: sulfurtransferase TusA family protein [Nitrosospira sp.]|nr:sulfurtransferase TusA family protein [Nitrosospira sp.]
MNCDRELDVRGLTCPLPILRTKKSLVDMNTGEVLKIMATDPGSVIDFQVFADQTGHELLSLSEAAGEFIFFMKKR